MVSRAVRATPDAAPGGKGVPGDPPPVAHPTNKPIPTKTAARDALGLKSRARLGGAALKVRDDRLVATFREHRG